MKHLLAKQRQMLIYEKQWLQQEDIKHLKLPPSTAAPESSSGGQRLSDDPTPIATSQVSMTRRRPNPRLRPADKAARTETSKPRQTQRRRVEQWGGWRSTENTSEMNASERWPPRDEREGWRRTALPCPVQLEPLRRQTPRDVQRVSPMQKKNMPTRKRKQHTTGQSESTNSRRTLERSRCLGCGKPL